MKVWQIAKPEEGKYTATLLTHEGEALVMFFDSPWKLRHFLEEQRKKGKVEVVQKRKPT